MPLTQVANQLWTPDGEVPLREKDVTPVTRQEIITLSHFHEFAQRHNITVVCKRCDTAITGANNGNSRLLSVSCKCREWRFDGR